MSIPERCWKCDKFNLDTETCSEAKQQDPEIRTAITATFSWGTPARPNPHLTSDFHKEIHPDNIKQIAEVMAKTAAAKMDCLNLCSFDEDAKYGQIGNA